MYRALIHFWRMNLAVIAGVAVTTAVLTGALMVGDSLRGSLRDLTLDRLGRTDQALLNNRFFPMDLASRLAQHPELESQGLKPVPGLVLRGSAVHVSSERRASGVQILGVEAGFASLFPMDPSATDLASDRAPNQIFPSVVLNETLARQLGAAPGEDVLLSFGRPSSVPTASLLGRRDQQTLLGTLRLTVTAVIPASGAGGFGLEARQTRPLNAFVDLDILQARLDKRGEVNLLLVGRGADLDDEAPSSDLQKALGESLRLPDLGLRLSTAPTFVVVESEELILRSAVADGVTRLAAELGATTWPYLTYLANRMVIGDRLLPYSTITALQTPVPAAIGTFAVRSGAPIGQLVSGQIALNSWAAEDLEAHIGDEVELAYFLVDSNDDLALATTRFEVASIVDMDSLAADPGLTPEVPGVSDAEDMTSWDPPFPVDLDLVRPRDETYWDEYRGAPKAFVSLATGQELWESRYGRLTAMRLVPATDSSVDRLRFQLADRLPRLLSPEQAGFRVLPVRAQGLEAASGTTDFAGLFLGFSLFLIVSAALLVALLFSLLVEGRAREAGLLLATGYSVRTIRWRFLLEGGVLGLLGTIVGTILAYGYTSAVLRGLAAWWSPVLDSPVLEVHLVPGTLIIGGLSALILVVAVIAGTVRRLSRAPARQLLAGRVTAAEGAGKRRRLATHLALSALVLAIVLMTISFLSGMESAPGLFFGVGGALLVTGIASYAAWAGKTRSAPAASPRRVVPNLAARNSSRNLGRSLLSVTLVASASFVLVSVSASRKTHSVDKQSRSSGTGGFSVVAEADTPLRTELGRVLEPSPGSFYNLRLLPGDDASCLNLYQPQEPRVLGVPNAFIERGGFGFRSVATQSDNPWELLQKPLEDGVIPAIGDYNSVRWILHSGLGQELLVEADDGATLRLRLVGLLDTSIFQSELLISEEMFVRHFPDHEGYAYFLGDLEADDLDSGLQELESRLSAYGFDAEAAIDRLAGFQAVENMYLTTFEVLGGLGLLLGTVGLGVILLRNTLERRGELAVLRSFGFRRSTLAWMVVAENAFLLLIGLTTGSVAGLVAVSPYLVTGGIQVPWWSLSGILLAVFGVGLISSVAAVMGSLRIPLLPALKAE